MEEFESNGQGFTITFENGTKISVQFGYGNYCDNKVVKQQTNGYTKSSDAEVRIDDKDGNWITKQYENGCDDVLGYRSPNEVVDAINWTKNYDKTHPV